MATSAAVELKAPVQRFVFTEENTIGDLFVTVNELEKAGKPPFLKFLGTRGAIVAVEVLVHDPEESGEMAVSGVDEDDQPKHSAACNDGYPEDCPTCNPEGS
jgi:hypothetical protein